MYYQIEANQLVGTIFFGVNLMAFGEPVAFWHQRRTQVAQLSDLLTVAAERLEELSTPDQIRHTNKVTRLSRVILYRYICDVSMCITNYATFPFQTGKLAANLPFLTDYSTYFWIACALQTYIEVTGSIAFGTMLSCHTETSLLLKCLFDTLGQHLQTAGSHEDIAVSIDVHQRLLEASAQMQHLFSRSWFSLMIVAVSVLTVNTYIIIVAGLAQPVYACLVVTILLVFLAPCYLSDMVSTAFENVGLAAYRNNWERKPPDMHRNLVLIILRSQRKFFFKAGMFGDLNMPKYQAILKNWYTLAQALIKTG